jgi:Holliday junction resolvasome RuvABC endonuclease subunit
MSLTIFGIDASLSSTGLAIAECIFDKSHKDYLFELLVGNNRTTKERLEKCFKISYSTEIKERKEEKKQLARVRKQIRDSEGMGVGPTLEDNFSVEKMVVDRVDYQVKTLISFIEKWESESKTKFVFTEDYSYHSQGSVTQLAELKGAFKTSLFEFFKTKDHYFYLNAPITAVKKVVGRNGNANKDLMSKEIERFGFSYQVSEDDEVDAIAISISVFYAIFHRLYPFSIVGGLDRKQKKYVQSFIDSLNVFSNRIGTREEIEALL